MKASIFYIILTYNQKLMKYKCLTSRLKFFEITYHDGIETGLKMGLQFIFVVVAARFMNRLKIILTNNSVEIRVSLSLVVRFLYMDFEFYWFCASTIDKELNDNKSKTA